MSAEELWAAAKVDAAGATVNSHRVTSTARISPGVFNVVLDHEMDTTEILITFTPFYDFGAITFPKVVATYALSTVDFRTVEIRIFDLAGGVADANFDLTVQRITPD